MHLFHSAEEDVSDGEEDDEDIASQVQAYEAFMEFWEARKQAGKIQKGKSKQEERVPPQRSSSPEERRSTPEAQPPFPPMIPSPHGMYTPFIMQAPVMPLPLLEKKIDIDAHLRVVEEILTERQLIIMGRFNTSIKASTASLVIESLKSFPDVHASAKDKYRQGLDWNEMRSDLSKEFGSRYHLIDEMETQLRQLSFRSPYTAFIADLKMMYNLNLRLYADSSDRRRIVRKIIQVVPAGVRKPLIEKFVKLGKYIEGTSN
jgi:hypothetical protein